MKILCRLSLLMYTLEVAYLPYCNIILHQSRKVWVGEASKEQNIQLQFIFQ